MPTEPDGKHPPLDSDEEGIHTAVEEPAQGGPDSADKEEELVIGLVCAVGTDISHVSSAIIETLREVNFDAVLIRVSDHFREIAGWEGLPLRPFDERVRAHMGVGTELRETCGRGDAAAMLAVGVIGEKRKELAKRSNRRAYILHQLKHPDEVKRLRSIYGSSFVLVAAYAPEDVRLRNLITKIREESPALSAKEHERRAQSLMKQDQSEVGTELGQSVRKTYPLADVFIDASAPQVLESDVRRTIELLFDCSFSTPTKEENAMFHAHAAALRSASLARQVGAVITTIDGDLLAAGTNEVPKAEGGLYWQGDDPDWRDFKWGHDTSDVGRKDLLVDVLNRLREGSMLAGIESEAEVEDLVSRTLSGEKTALTGTKLMDLIEFVRAVHAEMAALLAAARLGTCVRGCTLYTTTFPCHDCAKHIVAAGILRVVYIHPYPKSRALEMHNDSIVMGRAVGTRKAVAFESFVGIAPRKYMDLFTHIGERKDKQGKPITVDQAKAKPRLGEGPTSLEARRTAEDVEFKIFTDLLEERELLWDPK